MTFTAPVSVAVAVAQLLVSLRYKPEDRGFESLLGHRILFQVAKSFQPQSGSMRNDYQEPG
jgi:hypothetical protein